MIIRCKTDKGKVREINQDYVLTMKGSRYTLLIVADGMGGHNAGEIASKLAASSIKEFVFSFYEEYMEIDELIRDALLKANQEIYQESLRDESFKGMGTTVTCCLIIKDRLYMGHVGDSRAYIVNQSGIRKISEDHSYVQELVNKGSITENEAQRHPQRNIITRSVGTEEYVVVDTKVEVLEEGDYIFLCSDGLTSYVTAEEILCAVTRDFEGSVDELIGLANERGGSDNISIIVAGKDDENE